MSCYRQREVGVGVAREVSCGFGAGVKQAMPAAKTTANPISIRMFFFIYDLRFTTMFLMDKKIHFPCKVWVMVNDLLNMSGCALFPYIPIFGQPQ
jgi:hypothetical protein